MSERVLAVVPARSGSKRLPGKNIAPLDGKPLLAHTIEQAHDAAVIDRTVVSTEDEQFRDIAREWGGEAPFLRPEELATDEATADQVVRHVLAELREQNERYEYVCMLLVTTPFREPADIDQAIRTLVDSDAESIVSTTPFDHPPMYAVDTDDDGYLFPYFGEEYLWKQTRSQEFPDLRQPNGAIFAATTDAFTRHESFYTNRTLEYEMPPSRSLDIDEEFDLTVARALTQYDGGEDS
jgi:CMP-N-acetylneuraminic acid synthetase